MKEKDGYVNCPEQQVILYVEKEDGQYGPMQTGSYLSGNYLGDYEIKRYHLEQSLRERVMKSEISTVKYYMELEDLTLSELAARVGLRKSVVNKHLDPVHFGNVKVETLKKYARVFNVPVSNMLQLIMIKKGENLESYTILEEKKQTEGIDLVKTENPYVMLLKIGEK
jgi:transcriptional regulator with XRE-family HTH domain